MYHYIKNNKSVLEINGINSLDRKVQEALELLVWMKITRRTRWTFCIYNFMIISCRSSMPYSNWM